MPTIEAIRAALAAFAAGRASDAERQLVSEALRAGRLVVAENERSVAIGGSANGATIITGDGNFVLSLDAETGRALHELLAPPHQNPSLLLNRGIQQLAARSYQQAINTLRELINRDPSMPEAHYHLALALLRGRRPKILNRTEIGEIDELIGVESEMQSKNGLTHWFRALVRDDYYNGNRLTCPPPSIQEILSTASSRNTDPAEIQMLLNQLPMRGNRLYMALTKLITEA